jgi:hypothetical protein
MDLKPSHAKLGESAKAIAGEMKEYKKSCKLMKAIASKSKGSIK